MKFLDMDYKDLENITVGELVEKLNKIPKDTKINILSHGNVWLYDRVKNDQLELIIETE